MKTLKNKVAIITGGSAGIGLSIARLFASEGAKVVIIGRDKVKLSKARNSIKSNAVLALNGDISQISEIDAIYKNVFSKFGKIDILVANAGIGKTAKVASVDEDFFDSVVNVNYKGVFFTVQKAIPILNKNASVILISSVHTYMGMPNRSVYASTKAAVSQLAKNFAAELVERKIRVNSISPGFTKTTFLSMASNAFIKKLKEKIPLKKLAAPKEIAQVALFLASDKSSYITGTDILVDGGLSRLDKI